MSGGETAEFTFVCPECAETLEVNAPMKEMLIEKGCVVCSASVTTDAFSGSAASTNTQ